jgi:cell division septum initiation protein DivIVA
MAVHNNRSLGQHLSNFFRGLSHDQGSDESQPAGFAEQERWPQEEVLPRFPYARNGYHCATVDTYVAELEAELADVERELAELRARSGPRDEVTDQIKRVGEQTSAVLIAANEQREAMLRAAREEADQWVTDARARAALITSEGESRVRELRAERELVERERERLFEEVRNVSAALAALAGPPQGSIPPEAREEIAAADLR